MDSRESLASGPASLDHFLRKVMRKELPWAKARCSRATAAEGFGFSVPAGPRKQDSAGGGIEWTGWAGQFDREGMVPGVSRYLVRISLLEAVTRRR